MKATWPLAAALAAVMTISVAHAEQDHNYDAGYQGRTLIDIFRGREELVDNTKDQTSAKAAKPDVKTVTTVSVAGPYGAMISRHAAANGVPAHLARAVIQVESNYRVNARGSAGEIGLMQIKPTTARMLGYTGPAKGLYDPETNIRFGMKYLGMAHKLGGGDTCGTILRYNAGHAASRMNPISSAYCSKVKRLIARG